MVPMCVMLPNSPLVLNGVSGQLWFSYFHAHSFHYNLTMKFILVYVWQPQVEEQLHNQRMTALQLLEAAAMPWHDVHAESLAFAGCS